MRLVAAFGVLVGLFGTTVTVLDACTTALVSRSPARLGALSRAGKGRSDT